jgi:hypothetical protein
MCSRRPADTRDLRVWSPKPLLSRPTRNEAGFSLIEALAALTISALLVGLFLPFVAQSLAGRTSQLGQIEIGDQIMRASVRLQAEIGNLALVRLTVAGQQSPIPAFTGRSDSIVFVRATETNLGIESETIAFGVEDDGADSVLVRRTAPYDPSQFGIDPHAGASAVAVIAGKYRMRFEFVDDDGMRSDDWVGMPGLPARIELILQPKDARRSRPVTIDLIPAARVKISGSHLKNARKFS